MATCVSKKSSEGTENACHAAKMLAYTRRWLKRIVLTLFGSVVVALCLFVIGLLLAAIFDPSVGCPPTQARAANQQ